MTKTRKRAKTKKFIDKKNSVTFHLVHRSQKDPLVADETAPQRVLIPVASTRTNKTGRTVIQNEKRKEEQQKYGIYFDDNYDYLQHLRDVNTSSCEWVRVENANSKEDKQKDTKINLPSSVFASNVEEKIGMLNKAAPVTGPQLDLDPDVIAAMDDDFDYDDPENQLEDDFMKLANAEDDDNEEFNKDDEFQMDVSDDESDNNENKDENKDDELEKIEEADEVYSLNSSVETRSNMFEEEETKSRFTQYSKSSSAVPRNEHLRLLDAKFEKMYAEYDDTEIGALHGKKIEGHVTLDSDIMKELVREYEEKKNEKMNNLAQLMEDRAKIRIPDSEEELEEIVVDKREKNKWDCQSIRSRCSTTRKGPTIISDPPKPKKIEIDRKSGIPKNVLDNNGKLTAATLVQFDSLNNAEQSVKDGQSVAESRRSTLHSLSIRPKGETPDQRKERQKLLKEFRRERRIERKANRLAFKEEKKRQEKSIVNNRYNVQGKHLL